MNGVCVYNTKWKWISNKDRSGVNRMSLVNKLVYRLRSRVSCCKTMHHINRKFYRKYFRIGKDKTKAISTFLE